MSFLGSLFGTDAGNATLDAIGKNKDLLNSFNTQGNKIINTGETKSAGALNSAISGYQPWVDSGAAANTLYSDALGLNGADGNANATSAFQAGPGYQFALDQGTQAALRGASAAGMLNSGNTLTALNDYAQGQANQEYGSWLDRLKGTSDTGLTAASGQASGYGALSDLYQAGTDNRLGLANTVTQGKMGLNNQTAQVQEQQSANKGSLFGSLIGLGGKLISGGLF